MLVARQGALLQAGRFGGSKLGPTSRGSVAIHLLLLPLPAGAAAAALLCHQVAACPSFPLHNRALHLPKLDQQQMMDVRAAWFDGNYGPPPGNKRE